MPVPGVEPGSQDFQSHTLPFELYRLSKICYDKNDTLDPNLEK